MYFGIIDERSREIRLKIIWDTCGTFDFPLITKIVLSARREIEIGSINSKHGVEASVKRVVNTFLKCNQLNVIFFF